VKNRGGSFVNGVVCLVKNRVKVLIHNLNKTFPLFFTGCKLCPPGIGIEAKSYLYPLSLSVVLTELGALTCAIA